jgi:hypothetical protein
MIAARLIRISTMFAGRLSAAGQPQVGASIAALYPRELS